MKKTVYVLAAMLLLLCLSNTTSETVCASTIKCPDCGGNGSVKCTTCNGTGEGGELCYNCEGLGYLEDHVLEDEEECPVCHGLGFFYCSNCGGYGSVTCEKCGGSGSIVLKKNPAEIKTSVKTVKKTALRKAKKTIKPLTIKKAQGTVTVKKVKKGTSAQIYKKITVSKKTGAIKLAKGKYKKGTYKIKLKITVAGNKTYDKLNKTVTVKIKIK